MNTLVGNNGIMGNEYRPPALIFGNFVTRNMNTTNTGLITEQTAQQVSSGKRDQQI